MGLDLSEAITIVAWGKTNFDNMLGPGHYATIIRVSDKSFEERVDER